MTDPRALAGRNDQADDHPFMDDSPTVVDGLFAIAHAIQELTITVKGVTR